MTSNQNNKPAYVLKGVGKDCPRSGGHKKGGEAPVSEDLVRSTFNRYDANKDGRLSKQELKNAFDSLGSRMPGVRASLALHHADTNGDGYISQEEFVKLVKYTLKRGYVIK